jgi:glucose-1-phosphate adenylyltransferase
MSQSFLADDDWPIYTKEVEGPPTKVGDDAMVTNCLLSHGCKIEGRIERSIISPGVHVAQGAVVKDSVIMNDTHVGRNCVIDHAILDKEIVIEPDCHIGYGDDYRANKAHPDILNCGLTLVGKHTVTPSGYKVGRNCIIYDNVMEGDLPPAELKSGETVRARRKPIRFRA